MKKEEGRRKTEKNSYLCTRHLRVLLLGIGNWELGIGNWELGIIDVSAPDRY
jgi:hypothetical protein